MSFRNRFTVLAVSLSDIRLEDCWDLGAVRTVQGTPTKESALRYDTASFGRNMQDTTRKKVDTEVDAHDSLLVRTAFWLCASLYRKTEVPFGAKPSSIPFGE